MLLIVRAHFLHTMSLPVLDFRLLHTHSPYIYRFPNDRVAGKHDMQKLQRNIRGFVSCLLSYTRI